MSKKIFDLIMLIIVSVIALIWFIKIMLYAFN